MERKNLWTREELIVVLNLYWRIPYNKISGSTNSEINKFSKLIGRSSGAIAYKLMNFTSLDPERQKKGNKGKDGAGSLDIQIWNEFFERWEELDQESSRIISDFSGKTIEIAYNFEKETANYFGIEKERMIKTRVNQSEFRNRILASYNNKCCISGLGINQLLVASHIVPWSVNPEQRLNPRNGLCLNNLYDKAFDVGLITIDKNYKIKISNHILKNKDQSAINDYFLPIKDKEIILPDRFKPSSEFIEYHNDVKFNKVLGVSFDLNFI